MARRLREQPRWNGIIKGNKARSGIRRGTFFVQAGLLRPENWNVSFQKRKTAGITNATCGFSRKLSFTEALFPAKYNIAQTKGLVKRNPPFSSRRWGSPHVKRTCLYIANQPSCPRYETRRKVIHIISRSFSSSFFRTSNLSITRNLNNRREATSVVYNVHKITSTLIL